MSPGVGIVKVCLRQHKSGTIPGFCASAGRAQSLDPLRHRRLRSVRASVLCLCPSKGKSQLPAIAEFSEPCSPEGVRQSSFNNTRWGNNYTHQPLRYWGRPESVLKPCKEVFWIPVSADEALRVSAAKKAGSKISEIAGFQVLKSDKMLDVWYEYGQNIGSSNIPSNMRFPAVEVGRQWEPAEFVAQAQQLVHPHDQEVRLPPIVAGAIVEMARLGPTKLSALRQKELDWWQARVQELEWDEATLHDSLHANVQRVVSKKRILVFKELLEYINYDDMGVVDLLTGGIEIIGTLRRIGIWKPEDRSAKIDARTLSMNAFVAQRAVQKGKTAKDIDCEVWQKTLDEVEEGCLVGPFTQAEVTEQLGEAWIPSRRFPIVQGSKTRPIDNFSEHGINNAFGSMEKVTMLGLDQVVGWSRAWSSSWKPSGIVETTDTAGHKYWSPVSKEWSAESWSSLEGRVADLKSAYKQLAICPAHAALSVVAVLEPVSQQVKFFRAHSFMFGETAAVYGFLRFSRAIAAIACKVFKLIVAEFFDDFTQLEPAVTKASAQATMESLLDILGWTIATAPGKRLPFESMFVSLGIQIDLGKASQGEVTLAHKPGRIENLEKQIQEVISAKTMSFKEALSIRGKVYFSEGQVFGRIAAPVVFMLSRWTAQVLGPKSCWEK